MKCFLCARVEWLLHAPVVLEVRPIDFVGFAASMTSMERTTVAVQAINVSKATTTIVAQESATIICNVFLQLKPNALLVPPTFPK